MTTTETATQRVQTIYTPGSFTPLIRVETQTAELAKAVRRTLAEKFQQEANVSFPPEMVAMVDSLEAELQRGELSAANRAWLAQCGLTPEQIQNQIEPEYIPERKIHLYHCDHRGLPLALVNAEGKADWSAEYDAWGNVLSENNPHNMKQLIRLPGQQYDEETGLYYNRHRYYDPLQGRYITQDPIGLRGGWNLYQYPLNPVQGIDPFGLAACKVLYPDYPIEYMNGRTSTWLGGHGGIVGYDRKGSTKYYEYGRYNPSLEGIVGVKLPTDDGNIRNVIIPDLVLDKDGNPTNESLEKLKVALSAKAGKNTNAELTCSKDVDEKKMYEYINKVANDKKRDKYNWNPLSPNQCRSFADDAFDAGD
ncbi:RHS repeat protein [Salmonella enterica]|nr:RHS repeat protein [Salmonella enterica]